MEPEPVVGLDDPGTARLIQLVVVAAATVLHEAAVDTARTDRGRGSLGLVYVADVVGSASYIHETHRLEVGEILLLEGSSRSEDDRATLVSAGCSHVHRRLS